MSTRKFQIGDYVTVTNDAGFLGASAMRGNSYEVVENGPDNIKGEYTYKLSDRKTGLPVFNKAGRGYWEGFLKRSTKFLPGDKVRATANDAWNKVDMEVLQVEPKWYGVTCQHPVWGKGAFSESQLEFAGSSSDKAEVSAEPAPVEPNVVLRVVGKAYGYRESFSQETVDSLISLGIIHHNRTELHEDKVVKVYGIDDLDYKVQDHRAPKEDLYELYPQD